VFLGLRLFVFNSYCMTHAASSDEFLDKYFTELLHLIFPLVLRAYFFFFSLFCLYFRFSYFLSLFFIAPFFFDISCSFLIPSCCFLFLNLLNSY
jgi:hypothetical protein